MSKSLQQWLAEGEQIYAQMLEEYQQLQADLNTLESRLDEKKAELNRVALLIGKPQIEEPVRQLTAELIDPHGPNSVPNSPATIARALTGRALGR